MFGKKLLLTLLTAAAVFTCSGNVTVQAKAAAAPALTDANSWTMVIVPDIQTYIKQIENHGILDMMLAWIVRRRAVMNIQQVLFTGDLVYSNTPICRRKATGSKKKTMF